MKEILNKLSQVSYSPLDLLPQKNLREKLVGLAIQGVPAELHGDAKAVLEQLREQLLEPDVEDVRVVVFGGGTGLSNIIGGDSRQEHWVNGPFCGLKNIFPRINSIVCVTDNGGSTGELLKDIPLMAIGDIRHVLLSSIQKRNLQKKYSLDSDEAQRVVTVIAKLFNWRFKGPLKADDPDLQKFTERLRWLPTPLGNYLQFLVKFLLEDQRLERTRKRSHCFGNLLCTAAIYRETTPEFIFQSSHCDTQEMYRAVISGLNALSVAIGAGDSSVLPCTPTPAQLRVLYSNNVEITGEHKLGTVQRGFPIERVEVDYCDIPYVYPEVLKSIQEADIIIFAPGSLYSSIIPVLKVPGLAEVVRENNKALKVLVSNLWVQTGETDLSMADPERKFHVSDMLEAYEKNIPGGTKDLFKEILCVSLKDVPASVLQMYAVEDKIPIYLDRGELLDKQYSPIECDIYSQEALSRRGVIQHDPGRLALAVKALYSGLTGSERTDKADSPLKNVMDSSTSTIEGLRCCLYPCEKYSGIEARLGEVDVVFLGDDYGLSEAEVKASVLDILWDHPVIPLAHLQFFKDIHCIAKDKWNRDQKWDNVFSFFDPDDSCIKIRADQVGKRQFLEIAIMIALGESLLGNYAKSKIMENVVLGGVHLGRVYHLRLNSDATRKCYFTDEQLKAFLDLARMSPADDENHYTRLINRDEGFTPPGLLMGLMYAWYLDNRMATHIEYKMSVLKINQSGLIPEQLRMASRRQNMIQFYRNVVFGRSPEIRT